MSCTLQHYGNPSRDSGMLQIHADVPRSWLPDSPAGAHSPVFIVHTFPRSTACRPGKFGKAVPQMNFSLKEQRIHPHRRDVKAAERELLQFQAQGGKRGATTALYLPNISVSPMKLDFLRACISLPGSQGWKHPSEKHRRRQRETQRDFSIAGGVSRLHQNFSVLSLLPLSLKLFMLCRAQHLVNSGAENKQGAVPAT